MSLLVYTIGHSQREMDEFLRLLRMHQIEQLIDVRTLPGSRRVPQFNSDSLRTSLHAEGIAYRHMKSLGGLRKPAKNSVRNDGWRNASFRGFADYMQTREFADALNELAVLASHKRTALMCAEAVPWRCHRSLIADALLVRHSATVQHIISDKDLRPHQLTSF